jgi:hypothetical protein
MSRRTREMSNQAKAAAMIRKHLKAAYPNTKFSVRSDSFAGGDSVDISWTDGPTTEQVEQFSRQFQYGDFDGMRDIYELTNRRDDIPQSKYVHCQRSDSRDAYRAVVAMLNQRRGWNLVVDEDAAYNTLASGDDGPDMPYGYARDTIFRELQKASCVCPDCKAATLPGDQFCPECGNPQPVTCWMCDTLTEPRALTDVHGHRICASCWLFEVEREARTA